MSISNLVFSLSFLMLSLIYNAMHVNAGNMQGMFIFGSSVTDNGNNNFNPYTTAKANFAPYGVDYPGGSTGRFGNGKNIADIVAEYLGLPVIPPFSDPSTNGANVVHGVNFASGGSGILDETGLIAGKVTTLNQQIENFENVTLPTLEAQNGCQRAALLPNFLFMIAAGNNDYLLNYFIGKELLMTPQYFAAKLVFTYSDQLKRLYNLGARKFLLVSVYPLGCSPTVSRGTGCSPIPNGAVSIFYDQLTTMVDGLKSQLLGSDFVVVNSVKIITDIINNPGASGFSNTNSSCCQSINGAFCQENGTVCNDRKCYVYFDGQHNTEALNAAFVSKVYSSYDNADVYPANLQKLVHAHF